MWSRRPGYLQDPRSDLFQPQKPSRYLLQSVNISLARYNISSAWQHPPGIEPRSGRAPFQSLVSNEKVGRSMQQLTPSLSSSVACLACPGQEGGCGIGEEGRSDPPSRFHPASRRRFFFPPTGVPAHQDSPTTHAPAHPLSHETRPTLTPPSPPLLLARVVSRHSEPGSFSRQNARNADAVPAQVRNNDEGIEVG